MFAATDTAWAPWYIAHTDDKKRGRLNIVGRLWARILRAAQLRGTSPLPKAAARYVEPDLPLRYIPTPF